MWQSKSNMCHFGWGWPVNIVLYPIVLCELYSYSVAKYSSCHDYKWSLATGYFGQFINFPQPVTRAYVSILQK